MAVPQQSHSPGAPNGHRSLHTLDRTVVKPTQDASIRAQQSNSSRQTQNGDRAPTATDLHTRQSIHIDLEPAQHSSWPETIVCQAALAVLLTRYTGISKANLGLIRDESASFDGHQVQAHDTTYKAVSTHIQCDPTVEVPTLLRLVSLAHEEALRRNEPHLDSPNPTEPATFAAQISQAVLVATRQDESNGPIVQVQSRPLESRTHAAHTAHALILEYQTRRSSSALFAHFYPDLVEERQMMRFLRQLGRLLKQIRSDKPGVLIRELDAVTEEDATEINNWNSQQLTTITGLCIHEMISEQADTGPDRLAIAAWDGELTYSQLETLSSRLAGYFDSLRLGQESIIPILFEKSKWVIVGMLGVLKAGLAFTLLDCNTPRDRISRVCKQVSATISIASRDQSQIMQSFTQQCVVLNDEFFETVVPASTPGLSRVQSQNLAYVLFTSGSTGEPKGIMIEHQAFVSCATVFGPAHGIHRDTRALQFASYSFGACLVEIVSTLLAGGCVCIPSEDDRMNSIAEYVRHAEVDWVLFTPSFIRAIRPGDVPGLKTMVLAGEPITKDVQDIWASRVQLLYGYGQSETSTSCSLISVGPETKDLRNIGSGTGARLWVTAPDDPSRLSPIGCEGELVVESPGVARGYVNGPSVGSNPFMREPPAWYPSNKPGPGKFYRTGDLAVYQTDGTVSYVGRRDSQAKIRGHRIELGAVETHLRRFMDDDIALAVDIVEQPANSGPMLVGFLSGFVEEARRPSHTSTDELRLLPLKTVTVINNNLTSFLPSYSIPSRYILVGELPKTLTGKVDRRWLRQIGVELISRSRRAAVLQSSDSLDLTSLEAEIFNAWQQCLGVETNTCTHEDNFFELGGDSIIAIRFVNVTRSLGVVLSITEVLQNPTFAQLLSVVRTGTVSHESIPRTELRGPIQQSYAQGRLWFLYQLHPEVPWYNTQVSTRLRGALSVEALTMAIGALERRHETLRTTYHAENGEGVQIVHDFTGRKLRVVDLAAEDARELLRSEQLVPFSLTTEPGWRVSLLRLGPDDHIVSIVMHHIISDGWSVDLLARELRHLYQSGLQGHDPLEHIDPLPIQYRDFAVWQRQQDQIADQNSQLEYWKDQLSESCAAEFLADHPRPVMLSGNAGLEQFWVDGPLYHQLSSFCLRNQVTPFIVLLAAFRAAHFRLTGVNDATMGTPIANRNRKETENLIGFFVNTQCTRIAVDDDIKFVELVKQVEEVTGAAFANQDVPFEQIVSALLPSSLRDTSRNPLVQIMFAVHSQQNLGTLKLDGLTSEFVSPAPTTRFDLELHLFQEDSKFRGDLLFSTDLFSKETVSSIIGVSREILCRGLNEPDTPVSCFALTERAPEHFLNMAVTEYPRESSVVDEFQKQVESSPEAVAVRDASSQMTYKELNAHSDKLAAWLHNQSFAAESIIGVLAPRSCEAIVAFLGILKANLAYVPLDVNVLASRNEAILASLPGTQRRLVLVGSGTPNPFTNSGLGIESTLICDILKQCPVQLRLWSRVAPSSLAYVMFTSGSTGKPKGVMIEHRSILRLVIKSNVMEEVPMQAKIAHLSNLAFDASTWEIYGALLNGGTLVCIDHMTVLDTKALGDKILTEEVKATMMPTALFKQCVADIPEVLKTLDVVFIAGDRLDKREAITGQALLQRALYNAYGPTENGVLTTIYKVGSHDEMTNGVPIGQAVSNTAVYIMDHRQQVVPAGVIGELVVSGDGLARGYTDPTLNDRFAEVAIHGKVVRVYRTGDRARRRPSDGVVEFFGRMDRQLKIRGHRVEPEEVEHALTDDELVDTAAIVVCQDSEEQDQMVAFAAVHDDHLRVSGAVSQQVEGWATHFDTSTYQTIDNIDKGEVGTDFTGWTSMYDGSEIDKAEMHEWLSDTLSALLDHQAPGRVLEIGTGTGMILFNLGSEHDGYTGLDRYIGLDPSASAVNFVNQRLRLNPALLSKAEVHVGTATDLSKIHDFRPDLVVINSVVQYFPSRNYLSDVVEALARQPGVRRIFFGDVRSYPLNRQFLAERAAYALGSHACKEDIIRHIADLEEQEEELLVDPTFFTRLTRKLPGLVKHVEILPKAMNATNELSAYRYAAVIHIGSTSEQVRQVPAEAWIDFLESGLNKETLRQLLRLQMADDASGFVAVSNIPNAKTVQGRHITDMLDSESIGLADPLNVSIGTKIDYISLSAADLVDLGKELGFEVEMSWAQQRSFKGGLDAVFYPMTLHTHGRRVLFKFPADSSDGVALTNRPGRGSARRRIQSKIKERLHGLLPAYMIPSQVLVLDKLPLNSNGKVDRRHLLQLANNATSARTRTVTRTAPQSQIEAFLCKEFADVLGVDVGVDDSFFDLGGHSLMATKLASRINKRLNVDISVRDIFLHPSIAALLSAVSLGSARHDPISPTKLHGPTPQSFAQGRLWFLHQLNPAASWYNMPLAVRLRGPLSVDALSAALSTVQYRHETLRTTFQDKDGVGVQIVHPHRFQRLRVADVSGESGNNYAQILKGEQVAPFSLTSEPGWRVLLLRLGEHEHVLSIVMHHIVSDGWSIDVLAQELDKLYAAALHSRDPLSSIQSLPIQYHDFALWQREDKQAKRHADQLKYWVNQLKDSSPAYIMCDRARPAILSGKAEAVRFTIAGPRYHRLHAFCQSYQVTPFTALLAAFRATNYRLTGSQDATIGTPVANRNREELEHMIGFFVNTQCMRITVGDEDGLADLVQQVQVTAAAAFANQDVPFEKIVSAVLPGTRDLSRNPLVQVMFAVHSQQSLGKVHLENLDTELIHPEPTTRFDLEMHLFQEEQQLRAEIIFSIDLFERNTISSLATTFQEIVDRGLEDPQAPISYLALTYGLPEARGMSLMDGNSTDFPRESSIVDVFRVQVKASPGAVAVKDLHGQVTYAQLDHQSDKIASWLCTQGFDLESVIAVLAPRSCEAVAAFLGILKAGLAYLPLDVNVPTSRNEAILSSVPEKMSGGRLILVGSGTSNPWASKEMSIKTRGIADILADHSVPECWQRPALSPNSLAYVIFTSGSTGKPKGVMIEHRSVLRLVDRSNVMEKIPPRPNIAHLSNLAFDAAVWEIYGALLNGGKLVCIDYLTVVDTALGTALQSERIHAAFLPTALLKQCLVEIPAALSGLDVILAGGERLDPSDAAKARTLVRRAFYNVYGPTENCVFSTLWKISADEDHVHGVPIGKPVSNTGALILSQKLEVVSPGVLGELVVTGDGIARGYTDHSLNSGRFVDITIDGAKVRAYRTGDQARWRPTDGAIEFFGRLDRQVKIRGHRVEPGEVEHVVAADDIVDATAVIVYQDDNLGEDQLVAFATVHDSSHPETTSTSQQVESWAMHFENSTYEAVDAIDATDLGQDFMGWTSMYDGTAIDKAEMKEWLQDTVSALLDGRAAGKVLEIGTGTGMILFNLGSGLETYVGIDPSASAVAFVKERILASPHLADKAEVHVGTAADVTKFCHFQPDLVIINSVAQYFPSPDYLYEITEALVRIPGARRIFFGDMRSYPLNRGFLTRRALHALGESASKQSILQEVRELEDQEEELLVDPSFFTGLTSKLPVKHVEILPKQMEATNELSSYRYAAVIHVDASDPIYTVPSTAWTNFKESKLNTNSLRRLLQRATDPNEIVAISNIPNSKTALGERVAAILDLESIVAEARINSLDEAQKATLDGPLSAAELVAISNELGLRVELSCARQRSSGGALDAVFHHMKTDSKRVLYQFPTDSHKGAPLTNRPGRRSTMQRHQSQIRERLKTLLPPYMTPSRVIVLDEMPLNSNGKIDRHQLVQIAQTVPSHAPLNAPATPLNEVEALLCDTFTEILGVKVANTDSFFDLGGHSLMATRLAARINQRLKVNISVRDIFDRPRIADLSSMIGRGSSHHHPIQASQLSGPVTQSYAQGRLWFLYQLNPAASWYNMPFAIRLRGTLSLDSLATAIGALEKRHETLRTTFHEEGGDGFQIIHEYVQKELRIVDAVSSGFDAQLKQLRSQQMAPFSLASEPGWRVSLIRLANDDHILSIVMHHIISDGWSVDVLGKELEQFYSASLHGKDLSACVSPLSIQYRDFAVWQRQNDQIDEHRRQLDYWKAQLVDSSAAEFLADHSRPSILSGHADIGQFLIEGIVYEQLQSFCRTYQVTPFIVLLAAFRAAHYRLTGAEDATIGTPIANRNREEIEGIIGFFVNTQCMRVAIQGDMSFADLIETTKATAGTAFANQDVPFEQIVSALLPGIRDASRNPLVQVMFAVHSQENLGKIKLEGLESDFISPVPTTRFDLEMHMFQEQDRLRGDLLFSTDLFEEETISSTMMAFQEVLRRGLDEPQTEIGALPLVDGVPDLRAKGLLETQSVDCPRDASVVDVFRKQASMSPGAIAVEDSSTQMTYAQLDYQSDRLASWLCSEGFASEPESVVAVLAPRSCEAIVAFLGVLKASLAYLALDVNSTASRNTSILSSLPSTTLMLVGSSVADIFPTNIMTRQIADILVQHAVPSEWSVTAPKPTADSLAYVTFTSGSTGKPKGVMVEHHSILRLVMPKSNVMENVPPRATIAHLSNLAFDAAVWEMYAALLNGGSLVCIDYMSVVNIADLGIILQTKNIDAAFLPTALLKQCLVEIPDALASVHVILAGGERMDSQDAIKAQRLTKSAFYNIYGPTENCVFSTLWQLKPDQEFVQGVPIGHAVSGTAAYVMDQQQIVSAGIMGELIVTGEGIARGYTDPELNISRFVDLVIEGKKVRGYRTGDRVRRRPKDGAIEFFGRMDRQVKIRGHRVEPAEVEHIIAGDHLVDSVAVVTSPSDLDGKDQLVAFATVHSDRLNTLDGHGQQVEGWATLFEKSTYDAIESIHEIGNDFMGWTSMYDGSNIDKTEMQEWLQDTVTTLLDGQPAGNVLEIGTGTGMILFNLGSGLDYYVGLDPSASAVSFVREKIKASPVLANKAQVHVGTATDLENILASSPDFRPDLVVLNSVAQYFPSPEYLSDVMNTLVRLPGVKRLFLGDIRSYPLNRGFLAQRALHNLGDKTTKEAIMRQMQELEEEEEELLIDPVFFTKLATDLPGLVTHVEILPKRMAATNELSAYRYAAVVHIGPCKPRQSITSDNWINFEESGFDADLLRHHLRNVGNTTTAVAVNNILNPKTLFGTSIARMLDLEPVGLGKQKDWTAALRGEAARHDSPSAAELVAIGSELGLQVELSWARQRSNQGALDAIFHQVAPTNTGRVLFDFPTDSPEVVLTNQPGRRSARRSAQSKIKDRLHDLLPLYMIPSQIIILEKMPMNNNGKVDRHELQQLLKSVGKTKQPEAKVAPRNKTESLLCKDFTAVLGVEASVTDNFFDLGGHSLMATKLAARISKRLNVDLSVKDIFDKPRIIDLATSLQPNSALGERIKASKSPGPTRQSYAQGRLWFLHQLDPNALGYVTQLATRFRGTLSIKAITAAVHALEQRHEILRTTFEERDGVGMQITHEHHHQPLRIIDIPADKSYKEFLRSERTRLIDLSSHPGWRVCVLRLGQDDHVLSIVMHHIVYDGWSIDIIVRELGEFYRANLRGQDDPLSLVQPLPVQYRDYSLWQRTQAQVVVQRKQLQYWKDRLADSSAAEFLADRVRPSGLSGSAAVEHLTISGPTYQQLKHFCRQHDVTPFIVLLTAFRVAHYRLTGDGDATIGTPIANRNQEELENLIGFFVNTQCMRIVLGDETDFISLLQQVRATASAAFANQEVPFEQIVSAVQPRSRSTSRTPLIQVMFAVHDQRSLGRVDLEGLQSESILPDPTSRFDLEVHVFQESEREELRAELVYSTDLFERETVSSIAQTFQEVVQRGLGDPQIPVSCLRLTHGLPQLQARRLLDANSTNYPQNASVVDIFQEQSKTIPNKIAVRDQLMHITYAELDHKSDTLAAWLTAQGLAAESLIGVLAPRSCEAIIAFLGILKANMAYLPLDANAVTARDDTILSSLPGKRLVLVSSSMADTMFNGGVSVETRRITDILSQYTMPENWKNTTLRPVSTSLAYVLFTSGSTGRPKGVMVEHRSIVRLVTESNVMHKVPSQPTVSHLANLAFDMSVWEIYAALLNGGTLVCIDYLTVVDTRALAATFIREGINASMMPTAVFKQCLADVPDMFRSVDVLFAAGDRLDCHDAVLGRKLVRTALYNAYGPTENGVLTTIYEVGDEEMANGVPVGHCVSNTSAYIMDPRQQIVSPGVVGELVVAGNGISRGYTDPSLNINRFIDLVIDGRAIRAYRTGDRARWRPADGMIEFFGRMDRQIKIHGNRVEPAEVERAIAGSNLVDDCAVIVRQSDAEGRHIVAFVTSRRAGPAQMSAAEVSKLSVISEDHIKSHLRTCLPAYMIPARVSVLERLPTNANGKVDRHNLAELAQTLSLSGEQTRPRIAPRDEVEAVVCEAFSRVLAVKVSVTDNFFDIGGHSLMAVELLQAIRALGFPQLSLRDIFDYPVLHDLAFSLSSRFPRLASADTLTDHPCVAPFQLVAPEHQLQIKNGHVQRQIRAMGHPQAQIMDVYPATGLQCVFLSDPKTSSPRPPLTFFIDFPSGIDCERLTGNWSALIRNFDILRTTFIPMGGEIYQVVCDGLEIPIEIIKVATDLAGPTQQLRQRDLEQGLHLGDVFLRIAILEQQGLGVRTVLRISHALYDGISLRYLSAALETLSSGANIPPTPKFARYIQHAADNRQACQEYWADVLHGSSMTLLSAATNGQEARERIGGTLEAKRVIPVRSHSGAFRVTQATLFTTACALTIAEVSNQRDVVFGRVVSGREALPPGCQGIVGPCTNDVPVRVQLDANTSEKELLQHVQEQYLHSLPYQTLGFEDLRRHSTNWPLSVKNYGCCVSYQHSTIQAQNQSSAEGLRFEYFPGTGDIDGAAVAQVEAPVADDVPIHEVEFVAFPNQDQRSLEIMLVVGRSVCGPAAVETMLDMLCNHMATLVSIVASTD